MERHGARVCAASRTSDTGCTQDIVEGMVRVLERRFIGDVILKSGGFRKVRWSRAGMGKRGGVRLIYFNVLEDGLIVMSYFYAKNEQENILASELQKLKG